MFLPGGYEIKTKYDNVECQRLDNWNDHSLRNEDGIIRQGQTERNEDHSIGQSSSLRFKICERLVNSKVRYVFPPLQLPLIVGFNYARWGSKSIKGLFIKLIISSSTLN